MTTPSPLYACHDLPREARTYIAQDGWENMRDGYGNPCRVPRLVDVPHAMSTNCRYDRAHDDSRCAGCRSKGAGE